MAGKLVHREFPADDAGRATSFWNSPSAGTSRSSRQRIPHDAANRARRSASEPAGRPDRRLPWLRHGRDVEAASNKVKSIGGSVLMEKSPVPNMGYFAICQDTEGNTFGLWETDESAAAPS